MITQLHSGCDSECSPDATTVNDAAAQPHGYCSVYELLEKDRECWDSKNTLIINNM